MVPPRPPAEPQPERRRDALLALALAVLACLPFLAGFRGEFVYDDRPQIVGNHLIQENRHLGRALVSDVWAFKGEREEAWSNYWRPTFVLWLVVQHRLFGLGDTFGWHLASVLLHALVTVLAYFLLRRRGGLEWPLAGAVAGLFAAHPVHVESVAWISGSPDLLLAAALLAAALALPGRGDPRQALRWTAALACYAAALLAKEVAVVFPLLVAAAILLWSGGALRERARRALFTALPFAALAGLFLVLRTVVLGMVEIETRWRLTPVELLLNAPALLVFYLRQCAWPAVLGPSYPLRALAHEELGAGGFWIPALAVLALAALVVLLARRRPLAGLGAVGFLLLLLPAFNVNAFIPEQVVHDRYLYLPLLGFLVAVVVAAELGLRRLAGGRAGVAVLVAAALLVPALAWRTHVYARVWSDDLALWRHAVAVDPTSAFNHAELGRVLLQEGRRQEARAALDAALAIEPVTVAYLQRAQLALAERRFGDAETDLLEVLRYQADNPQAYDRLALVYQAQGRLDEARRLLATGRRRVPHRACGMTVNLAVLAYLANDKAAALAELETARTLIDREPTVPCLRGLLHLANLNAELGRGAEARAALEELRDRTAGHEAPGMARLHRQAVGALPPGS